MRQTGCLLVLVMLLLGPLYSHQQNQRFVTNLLKLLGLTPSSESIDYIQNRTQYFPQHTSTEQPHPKTRNFSQMIREDTVKGLRQILVSFEDIEKTLAAVAENTFLLNRLVRSIERAAVTGHKIYIYSGATNSLAKHLESTLWRPFWKKVKGTGRIWKKLDASMTAGIQDLLIGEMTGGDRALMGSMEGLNDLLLMGWLQLEEHDIQKDDVVICISEGGETPSVIGALQAVVEQWKTGGSYDPQNAQKHLFFIYNNPEEQLLNLDRTETLIEEPGITKINLSTGPQSISGMTRLQAATINAFFLGHVLQCALHRILMKDLSKKEMARIGFLDDYPLEEKLLESPTILKEIEDNLPELAEIVRLEAEAYRSNHQTTYFARKGALAVLSDKTGGILDFSLPPLDTNKNEARTSWVQVWTAASDREASWQVFLGRDFRGIDRSRYSRPFTEVLADPGEKKRALELLQLTGEDQKYLYDFSMAPFNLTNRSPGTGDLGVCVLLNGEEISLVDKNSYLRRYLQLFSPGAKKLAFIFVHGQSESDFQKRLDKISASEGITNDAQITLSVDSTNDPLAINQLITLKILLNTLSAAVMADLGKIVGNTMTSLRPSNYQFIGRATYLIQSHVNDTLNHPEWIKSHGLRNPISFGEANAVLFATKQYLKDKNVPAESVSAIGLSIIQILESLKQRSGLSLDEAFEIYENRELSLYLSQIINP